MEASLSEQLNFPLAWMVVSLAITTPLFYLYALRKSHVREENGNVKLEPIPGPKPLPILGNALQLDINALVASVISLAWRYRPLFSLSVLGDRFIVVGTPELCRELCDETKFYKFVAMGLERLRPVTGDGLFTAFHGNDAWGVAHRLLLPLFGTFRIRDMFDDMRDVADQLCLKWQVQWICSRRTDSADFRDYPGRVLQKERD
ncbi:hypothetical protein FJTKL_12185 [Diaporthe vaccinii]|uniref:Cytochrome P450 n=1 Tax=Diaporthe vaccinii TaxID=105482 RepID=A0ABR4EEQ1_9PEZI